MWASDFFPPCRFSPLLYVPAKICQIRNSSTMSCCRSSSSTAENAHSTQLIYYILDRRCRTVSPKNTYPLYFSGSRLVVGSLWKCEESATIWRHCDCRRAILVLTAEAARGHAADRVRAREHTEQNKP